MTSYPLAQYSWDDQEVITVSSENDSLIGTFPLQFLRQGGIEVDTWEYILDVISQLVDGDTRGSFRTVDGEIVSADGRPHPGDYYYVNQSQCSCCQISYADDRSDGQTDVTFARGPEYFRRNIPPNPNGSQSTRSNSKRSTAQQVTRSPRVINVQADGISQTTFRIALIARDFSCLITDTPYEECTACHIVPQSRPDVSFR